MSYNNQDYVNWLIEHACVNYYLSELNLADAKVQMAIKMAAAKDDPSVTPPRKSARVMDADTQSAFNDWVTINYPDAVPLLRS